MTLLTSKSISEGDKTGIATFVFPPKTFGETQEHPIRVFQMNWLVSACPRDKFLIMASMTLPESQDTKPLEKMLSEFFPSIGEERFTECFKGQVGEETKDEAAEEDPVIFAVMYK